MNAEERRKRIKELEALIVDSESELSLLLAEAEEEGDNDEGSEEEG